MTVANETPRPKWASAITTPTASAKPKSWLFYGLPGTGKSTLAGGIALVPGFDKVLFIDIDQGSSVLAQNPLFRDKIDILPINPMEQGAKGKIDALIKDICENDYGYDAVILDTIDVGQDVAEKVFAAENPNPKDGYYVYRHLGVWTDEIARSLHSSPHFTAIILAHSVEQKQESGAFRVLPRLSGSSKDAIGGIPDVVGYLYWGNHPQTGERHLMVDLGQSDTKITKERYGFPPVVVDPTLGKLYQLINERVGKPAPAQTATKEEQQ